MEAFLVLPYCPTGFMIIIPTVANIELGGRVAILGGGAYCNGTVLTWTLSRGGCARSLIMLVHHRNCATPTKPTSTCWVSISLHRLCIKFIHQTCSHAQCGHTMHGILIVHNLLWTLGVLAVLAPDPWAGMIHCSWRCVRDFKLKCPWCHTVFFLSIVLCAVPAGRAFIYWCGGLEEEHWTYPILPLRQCDRLVLEGQGWHSDDLRFIISWG